MSRQTLIFQELSYAQSASIPGLTTPTSLTKLVSFQQERAWAIVSIELTTAAAHNVDPTPCVVSLVKGTDQASIAWPIAENVLINHVYGDRVIGNYSSTITFASSDGIRIPAKMPVTLYGFQSELSHVLLRARCVLSTFYVK